MEQEILDAIPHRPPFLFVDSLVEMGEDGAVCQREWREDEDFYSGHYPGNPITPGVLLCESVFQTAGVFLVKKLKQAGEFASDKVPILSRINGAKFKRQVKPGDVVQIHVSIEETKGRFQYMRGKITCDGKLCMSLQFVLVLLDGDKE